MRAVSRKHRLVRFRVFIILILLVTCFIIMDNRIRPIVYEISKHNAKQAAVLTINESVEQLMTEKNNDFSNLAHIKYNNIGDITSVETDVTGINYLQSQIAKKVTNDFIKLSEKNIELSLGTLSGVTLFNNIGPKIKMKVLPLGNVETKLKSTFKNAGINQSNHQIILDVNAEMITVFPGYTQKNEINLEYILSDTVIVGNVPDGYTYIAGDNRDIISKSNDYVNK